MTLYCLLDFSSVTKSDSWAFAINSDSYWSPQIILFWMSNVNTKYEKKA